MRYRRYLVQSIVSFIWIGCVSSISFMEAWLKFRAAQVTLSIGLSIGQLVFEMLNKMEWAFALLILGFFMFRKSSSILYILLFIPMLILVLQTFWLLPELQARVQIILAGNKLSPSPVHFYYLGLETIKVVCLFIFGVLSFPNEKEGDRESKRSFEKT